MPTFDNPIFEYAAQSLAALRQPDFADFSSAEISAAMSTVLTPNGPDLTWLAQLKMRIHELTAGLVHLDDANPDEFPFLVKTMGATYYRLVGLFRTHLVVISIAHPPFLFVDASHS
jgi:hypothetical protein